MERQEEIEGCCCSAGTLAVTVDVNKSGFVPGEPLVYDIKIDNKSDNTIGLIHLILEQVCQMLFCLLNHYHCMAADNKLIIFILIIHRTYYILY